MTARLIEGWLARPKWSPRTRNNNRGSIVTLFNYARKHGYLPRDEQTEADLVDKAKDTGNKILWVARTTPEQLRTPKSATLNVFAASVHSSASSYDRL